MSESRALCFQLEFHVGCDLPIGTGALKCSFILYSPHYSKPLMVAHIDTATMITTTLTDAKRECDKLISGDTGMGWSSSEDLGVKRQNLAFRSFDQSSSLMCAG